MKSRELLFCLAASFFVLPGCQTTPRPSAKPAAGPAVVTLEMRGHRITFHVGGRETRYTVANAQGHLLANEATREELRTSHPELYELVRSAIVLAQSVGES